MDGAVHGSGRRAAPGISGPMGPRCGLEEVVVIAWCSFVSAVLGLVAAARAAFALRKAEDRLHDLQREIEVLRATRSGRRS